MMAIMCFSAPQWLSLTLSVILSLVQETQVKSTPLKPLYILALMSKRPGTERSSIAVHKSTREATADSFSDGARSRDAVIHIHIDSSLRVV